MKRSRVTDQGTAMPEATLCFEHFDGPHIRQADAAADAASDRDPERRWVDSTGNTEVHCIVCGD